MVEQACMSTPGSHAGQLVLERINRLEHFLLGRLADLSNGCGHVIQALK
jgi:hypothetical protein